MNSDDDGEVLTGGRQWSGERERTPQWFQQLGKTPQAKPDATEDRAYSAFDTRERADRIELRRATQPSRFPSYSYLIDMSFDHHLRTAIMLFYSFGMVVEITGENLGPIAHAIHFGTCERITEFHKDLYDSPAPGEPLVKSISIQTAKALTERP
jgi:hypothetical protein